jgi:hypothetical protein
MDTDKRCKSRRKKPDSNASEGLLNTLNFFDALTPLSMSRSLFAAVTYLLQAHAFYVPLRRLSEQAAIFSTELRRAFIPHQPSRTARVDILT